MNARHFLAAAAAALGIAAGIASASEAKRSIGEYADDKIVLARVKSALIGDRTTEAHEINVEVDRGVVQLSGFVDTEREKDRAALLARGVEGVKRVENRLIVKPASTTAGALVDDATLTARVKTALLKDPATRSLRIKVETKFGVVQLSGFVNDGAVRAAAGEVAASVKGVKSVRNDLGVRKE